MKIRTTSNVAALPGRLKLLNLESCLHNQLDTTDHKPGF